MCLLQPQLWWEELLPLVSFFHMLILPSLAYSPESWKGKVPRYTPQTSKILCRCLTAISISPSCPHQRWFCRNSALTPGETEVGSDGLEGDRAFMTFQSTGSHLKKLKQSDTNPVQLSSCQQLAGSGRLQQRQSLEEYPYCSSRKKAWVPDL